MISEETLLTVAATHTHAIAEDGHHAITKLTLSTSCSGELKTNNLDNSFDATTGT